MLMRFSLVVLVACALAAAVNAAPAVHVRFFHTECEECARVRGVLDDISGRYAGRIVIHDYDYMVPSNYLLLVELETALGITVEQPVGVYVGSNAVYGVEQIEAHVEPLIVAGLEYGVPLWLPVSGTNAAVSVEEQPPDESNAVVQRYRRFTPLAVAGAGLIDGVNPCAFATLVLFISLLTVYSNSKRDIIATGLVFAAAIFLTYFLLGLALHGLLAWVRAIPFAARSINLLLIAVCVVCAILSARDAWKVWQAGKQEDMALGLPHSWREKISRLLSQYTGRRRWLLGVFAVGIVVSLIESVCTGQVYVPTLNYIVRSGAERAAALTLLVLYNIMFVVPLLLLTVLAAQGLNSRRLLTWQSSHAVSVRLGMAGLFVLLAVLLVVT
jgi:cytochrome c biogenesis protein CcdA